MQGRFGVREICNVTFKALSNGTKIGTKTFKAGQPVFVIDTATTSNMEQATTTVHAQGGRGYNRLISWEGEKTMTFTVTDALMSPMGMAVLSGAGLIDASASKMAHVHISYDVNIDNSGVGKITLDELNSELGLSASTLYYCSDIPMFGMKTNSAGSVIDYINDTDITVNGASGDEDYLLEITAQNPLQFTIANITEGCSAKVDFYIAFRDNVQTINILPDSFGGFFYVEADTLFRDEATGKDLAASIIFPKVKVQSGFTFTMAASGDPSTFDFVMEAMPAYTMFDRTKKTVCDIQIVTAGDVTNTNFHTDISADTHTAETPVVTPTVTLGNLTEGTGVVTGSYTVTGSTDEPTITATADDVAIAAGKITAGSGSISIDVSDLTSGAVVAVTATLGESTDTKSITLA